MSYSSDTKLPEVTKWQETWTNPTPLPAGGRMFGEYASKYRADQLRDTDKRFAGGDIKLPESEQRGIRDLNGNGDMVHEQQKAQHPGARRFQAKRIG